MSSARVNECAAADQNVDMTACATRDKLTDLIFRRKYVRKLNAFSDEHLDQHRKAGRRRMEAGNTLRPLLIVLPAKGQLAGRGLRVQPGSVRP